METAASWVARPVEIDGDIRPVVSDFQEFVPEDLESVSISYWYHNAIISYKQERSRTLQLSGNNNIHYQLIIGAYPNFGWQGLFINLNLVISRRQIPG